MKQFFQEAIQVFFVYAPFFSLTMFLSMSRQLSGEERKKLAIKVTSSVILISLILFFGGPTIFNALGITIHSFRIGAGILLLLSAISLVQKSSTQSRTVNAEEDISVVPLSIPITVGPATIGTLMVFGSRPSPLVDKLTTAGSILCAALCVGLILYTAHFIEQRLGKRGIEILTKITGLILAAMASEMIMTGVKQMMA